MAKYEIVPLVLGTVEGDKSTMMYFMDFGVKIKLPVVAFYLKGGDKNICSHSSSVKLILGFFLLED